MGRLSSDAKGRVAPVVSQIIITNFIVEKSDIFEHLLHEAAVSCRPLTEAENCWASYRFPQKYSILQDFTICIIEEVFVLFRKN